MAFDAQSAMTVILGQFVLLTYYNFLSRTANSDIKVKIVGMMSKIDISFIILYHIMNAQNRKQ